MINVHYFLLKCGNVAPTPALVLTTGPHKSTKCGNVAPTPALTTGPHKPTKCGNVAPTPAPVLTTRWHNPQQVWMTLHTENTAWLSWLDF